MTDHKIVKTFIYNTMKRGKLLVTANSVYSHKYTIWTVVHEPDGLFRDVVISIKHKIARKNDVVLGTL